MSPINSRLRYMQYWQLLPVKTNVLDQAYFQLATASTLDRIRAPLSEAVWSWRWPQ